MLANALDTAANLRAQADALYRDAEQRIASAISDELSALEGVTWTGLDASEEGTVLHYGAMTIGGKTVDVVMTAQTRPPARWSVWLIDDHGTICSSADTAAGALAKARAAWVAR